MTKIKSELVVLADETLNEIVKAELKKEDEKELTIEELLHENTGRNERTGSSKDNRKGKSGSCP